MVNTKLFNRYTVGARLSSGHTMRAMETTEPELPRAVALAWGVAANPQRGPKRELSIERIVDVAVELADAGGLASVSMAAIAGVLGVTPMALYRYVSAKDDLVLLMQEQGIGVPPESVREQADWRTGIEVWERAMADVYFQHMWLLDVPIEGTPTTPNNLSWLEAALEVMQPLPLDGTAKVSIALALIAQVRWEAHIVRGYIAAAAGAESEVVDLRAEQLLHALVTPTEFPFVHAALLEGVFSPESDGDPFAFGRDRVLDGVEALLAGRTVQREPVGTDPRELAVAREPKVRDALKARREAEKSLREARKREREAVASALEKLAR